MKLKGINCSHSITYYDNILWYKQQQGALKLLGYLNGKFLNLEDSVKGKISFDGEGNKHSSFTISDLTLNDSGVYFCAVRESDTFSPSFTCCFPSDRKSVIHLQVESGTVSWESLLGHFRTTSPEISFIFCSSQHMSQANSSSVLQ
uniref:Ig-like domain-containing protein n=1 Tax=Dicentrarchus labrax TaxID=13489 RepID=A0A8P4KKD0_DICLA